MNKITKSKTIKVEIDIENVVDKTMDTITDAICDFGRESS